MTENQSTHNLSTPSPDHEKSGPARLGDLLPDVLAEMRRLQKEAGR